MFFAIPRRALPLLLSFSIGSGAAALIYEIVWLQLLELVVGSSAVSLAVLLATFMGGTCLGSVILPRMVPSRYDPLRVYALVELGIAVLAVLVLLVMPFVGAVYAEWAGYGFGGFLLRGAVAGICLLPPTFLMGATLPLLARRVETTTHGLSWLGFLYAGNIAGAVLGCLAAGFYLLRVHDVTTATLVAAAINVVVAVIAWLQKYDVRDVPPAPVEIPLRGSSRRLEACVYATILLSGFCAMASESIWTRMLGLLLGASVYTFAIILAVFLAGLGMGSAIGSLICRTVSSPRMALAACQLLNAGAIAWTAHMLGASFPYWPITPSLSASIWFNLQLDLNRALWALLPPTLLWGASFPFALAALTSRRQDPGKLVSTVYAANTIGAIAGALCANLLFIGWIGSQRSEQLLIAVSAAAGLLMLMSEEAPGLRWRWSVAVPAVLAAGLLIATVPPLSKDLVTHGRFAPTWAGKSDIVYAREGMNAAVAVSVFPNGARTFHVAGKIQASSVERDMRLQRMLGHLTSLAPPHARSVLVIGCGAGVTAGAVSIDPQIERVTIVEIEPLVPEAASAYFAEQNFDVVRSPKVRMRIDDGRHYLLTTQERFDAITADPLDPWVKGAANLYTKEFFEAARRRLNPGGVVTVYIQLFETNLDAVKSAVATFLEVFPNGTVWGNTYEGRGHDMLLLGQAEPVRIDLDEMDERLRRPEYAHVAQSLSDIGMNSVVDLFATYAGRGSDLKEWLKDAAINRDRNLRMQYLAGTALNLDESAAIYEDMLAYRTFPADLFVSKNGRIDSLRAAILRESQ